MDAIRRCLNSANALNIFSGASSRTTSAQSYAESQSVPRRHFDFRFFDFSKAVQTRLATWSVILCELELRFFDFSIFQRQCRQGLLGKKNLKF